MKVYLVFNEVIGGIGDLVDLRGIFTTEEKAKAFVAGVPLDGYYKRCNHRWEERDLDDLLDREWKP